MVRDTFHSAGIGNQQVTLGIPLAVPPDAGPSVMLQADVERVGTGTVRSDSVVFSVQPGPMISQVVPSTGAVLGSNVVTFSWKTNVASSTSVFYRQAPPGEQDGEGGAPASRVENGGANSFSHRGTAPRAPQAGRIGIPFRRASA